VKILMVHNEYSIFTGEEAVVQGLLRLLGSRRHEIIPFIRSSTEIPHMRFGKYKAFCNGIYSFSSKRTFRKLLSAHKPDIVHIHNVFPFISPSILCECKKAAIPVVMTVHNYRLFCPTGLYMINGQICEKCNDGEYWCVLRNCTGSLAKSIGYALRNYVARKRRLYLDNVSIYVALTKFQRQRLIRGGFPADRTFVIPNMFERDGTAVPEKLGWYVGYVGRISPEKGVETLITAARMYPDISFKAAGSYDRMLHLLAEAPPNFEFCGHLDNQKLEAFYSNSRIIVLCSICYEGFPSVLVEAMIHSKPVSCSRIGGLPEIVDDGVTGLLFEQSNADELAEKIRYLWDRPDLCRKMGEAGREKALREYSPQRYYERLMEVYQRAIGIVRKQNCEVMSGQSC